MRRNGYMCKINSGYHTRAFPEWFLKTNFYEFDPDIDRSAVIVEGKCRLELPVNAFVKLGKPDLFREIALPFCPHVEPEPFGPEKHALDIAIFPAFHVPGNKFLKRRILIHKQRNDSVPVLNGFYRPGTRGPKEGCRNREHTRQMHG